MEKKHKWTRLGLSMVLLSLYSFSSCLHIRQQLGVDLNKVLLPALAASTLPEASDSSSVCYPYRGASPNLVCPTLPGEPSASTVPFSSNDDLNNNSGRPKEELDRLKEVQQSEFNNPIPNLIRATSDTVICKNRCITNPSWEKLRLENGLAD